MSVLVGPDLCGGMGGRGCCCLGGSGWGGVWWLLPELLAGVPPPLLCVGTCGGGGRSSGVRLTSGVPCDPLWPPLLPRLPSAVTLSSSLSSESEILITISMLVQLSYGASQRALLHFLTTGWVVSMVGSSLEEAGLNPTTLQIEIFQSLPRGLWQPKCCPEDNWSTLILDEVFKWIKMTSGGKHKPKQDGATANTCLCHEADHQATQKKPTGAIRRLKIMS